MLLPATYPLPPVTALIMLAGIYYGASYGGSTTAILVNLPGEMSSVVTVLDGHQMALQGRAGAALCIAALGSLFAGSVATFVIAAFAPPLAEMALSFDAAEYFALMVLGLAFSHRAGPRLGTEGSADDFAGSAPRHRRHGPQFQCCSLLVRSAGTRRWHRLCRDDDGPVRYLQRLPSNLEKTQVRQSVCRPDRRALDPSGRIFKQAFPAVLRGTALGIRARRHTGRRRNARRFRRLRRGEESGERSFSIRQGCYRGGRVPSPPTTRAPRRHSSRCSRWAFRRTP